MGCIEVTYVDYILKGDGKKVAFEKTKKEMERLSKEIDKDIRILAKELNISVKDACEAIYKAVLGRSTGPRASYVILALSPHQLHSLFESLRK